MVNFTRLAQDLAHESTTPNFAFITPNLCHDGHDAKCKDGETGGLVGADAFLQKTVPMILNSPAYKEDGLLIITFDEASLDAAPDGKGNFVISAAGETCCGQQPGPNIGP